MRPTNQEVYERTTEIEAGAEAAAGTAQAAYPDHKLIEAEVKTNAAGAVTGYEVTMGAYTEDPATGERTYTITEVRLDVNGAIAGTEDRPDVPPGQEDKEKGGKPEKPDKHEKPLVERKSDTRSRRP